jgi:hypothetical protein
MVAMPIALQNRNIGLKNAASGRRDYGRIEVTKRKKA